MDQTQVSCIAGGENHLSHPSRSTPVYIPALALYKEQACPYSGLQLHGSPTETLREFTVLPLVSFHWGRPRNLIAQHRAAVPFWGEDLGTSRTTECSFLVGDKWPHEPLVSASRSQPSWPLGGLRTSFKERFPLPLVLLPFLKSLYFPSLWPLLSPSQTVDVRHLQHPCSQLL